MLLKLLSPQDKSDFLVLAELITICDKPLLCEGRKIEELTSQSNFDNLTIQKGGTDVALMDELTKECNVDNFVNFVNLMNNGKGFFGSPINETVEKKLLKKLKKHPLQKIEELTTRLGVALEVLRDLLKDKKSELPSVPKLQLFELMQVALVDGSISSIQIQLLNEFAQHFKLESYVFTELLERAEVTSREINKTLTIILE
jgi:hypothetical protein